MEKRIGIIHISDLHLKTSEVDFLSKITRNIIEDLQRLMIRFDFKCEIVVFSGDIVDAGENSEKVYDAVYNSVCIPLREILQIKSNNFISIPGNHDIDRSKIDEIFHDGLYSKLKSDGLDNLNFDNVNITNKLLNYFAFEKKLSDVKTPYIVHTQIISFSDFSIGVTKINTAWSLSTKDQFDRKNIWIPKSLLEESFDKVKKSKIKICIMHHPTDWINDDNYSKIENKIDKYDIVLIGHKHYGSAKSISTSNAISRHFMAPRLGPITGESGYSIFVLDSDNESLGILHRKYNEKREQFINDSDFGDDEYIKQDLNFHDITIAKVYNVFSETKHSFFKSLSKLFIAAHIIEKDKDFEEYFVLPRIQLIDQEPSNKKTESSPSQCISDILYSDNPVVILGYKQSGKTMFIHYLAKKFFELKRSLSKYPIIIDFAEKSKVTKDDFLKAAKNFIEDYSGENFSISKSTISELIENGRFVFIIDNCDSNEVNESLKSIIKLFYKCKFIITRNEKMGYFVNEDILPSDYDFENIKFEKYNIMYMTKGDIRELSEKYISSERCDDELLDRIVKDIDSIGMTRTPFNVSLIIYIYSIINQYNPINQTKVIEQFMESILEKLNPSEQLSGTFDFQDKESFLSYLAYENWKNGSFSISISKFEKFLEDYHHKRSYLIKDTKFDEIFFDKLILVKYRGNVCFRLKFMQQYYLAKYALINEVFYEKMLIDEEFVNFDEEIKYVSGLKRDDARLINVFKNKLDKISEGFGDTTALFNTDDIDVNFFGKSYEDLLNVIEEQKALPTSEKDQLTDLQPNQNGYNPSESNKIEINSDLEKLGILIDILGTITKNCNTIPDKNLKISAIESFIHSSMKLWGEMKVISMEIFKAINTDRLIKSMLEKDMDNNAIREQLDDIIHEMKNAVTLVTPIAIESFMFQSIGSTKLGLLFQEVYLKISYNTPLKLLLLLLIMDIRHESWKENLREFAQKTNRTDYLQVIFFKCSYLNVFGYSNGDEQFIKQIQKEVTRKLKIEYIE